MSESVKLPAASERAKEIVLEMSELLDKRRKKASRVRDAILYFKKDMSKKDVLAGLQETRTILDEIEEVDLQIRDLQTEYVIAAEALYADVAFKIHVPSHEGDVGIVPAKTLSFGAGDLVDVSAEDIWFLQISTKLFGSNPLDLTFGS